MKSAASLTLGSLTRAVCVIGVFALIPFLCLPGNTTAAQTLARELQAKLSSARIISGPDNEPEVSATLTLVLGDRAQRITTRAAFHKMTLDADHPTTGYFYLYNSTDDAIFEGHWFATTFRDGATLVSLEGTGDGPYALRRLKLKIKATTRAESGTNSVLSGEGSGEIR